MIWLFFSNLSLCEFQIIVNFVKSTTVHCMHMQQQCASVLYISWWILLWPHTYAKCLKNLAYFFCLETRTPGFIIFLLLVCINLIGFRCVKNKSVLETDQREKGGRSWITISFYIGKFRTNIPNFYHIVSYSFMN